MHLDLAPFWISLKTTFASTALVLVTGVTAASWRTGRTNRLWELFDGVLLLPLVLPPTVVGFFLLVLLGRNGILGSLLWRLSLSFVFNWPATVLAATVVTFPLMYLTARGALEQIDTGMLEAARTLGA